jgi:single-strand DNA-binding protein
MPDVGSINKVILLGYLGKDPELETNLNNSQKFTVLSVATKEHFGKRSGKKPETTWHKCVAWGKAAEIICKYGKAGTLVAIDGRIRRSEWETRDGQKRKSSDVLVQTLTIVGGKLREVTEPPPDIDFEEEDDNETAPY